MKWIIGGLSIAVIAAFFGLATAQLPAPTGQDKALIYVCIGLIVTGLGMALVGAFLAIRNRIIARRERARSNDP